MGLPVVVLPVGSQYGKWTVCDYPVSNGKKRMHPCRCSCGTERLIQAHKLVAGNTLGCSACHMDRLHEAKVTHGASRPGPDNLTYRRWTVMKERCSNEAHPHFHHYGGRGIVVCERWQKFENFFADMGHPPTPDMTIERKDNSGNYEPSNCRWATRKEQVRNRRKTVMVEFRGSRMALADAVELAGHAVRSPFYHRAYLRIRNGESADLVLG